MVPVDMWTMSLPMGPEILRRYRQETSDGAAGAEWVRRSRKSETEGGFDSDEEFAGDEDIDPEEKSSSMLVGVSQRMLSADPDDEDS